MGFFDWPITKKCVLSWATPKRQTLNSSNKLNMAWCTMTLVVKVADPDDPNLTVCQAYFG